MLSELKDGTQSLPSLQNRNFSLVKQHLKWRFEELNDSGYLCFVLTFSSITA